MMTDLITARIDEFSRLTGLHRNTIYRMLERGELRSVKLGGCRLILMDSYRELLQRASEEAERKHRRRDRFKVVADA